MIELNFEEAIIGKLKGFSNLLDQGKNLGLDLSSVKEKVDRIAQTIQSGVVKIVLLGSFSDGKTSAVAGLTGFLDDSMKIDIDESSDELRVYRPFGLKKGFEIVDTPGLFGTKEKEIDGKNIRLSEITERYISEAHIIVYLCDAVVPLKDSHVEVIRKVMRNFNKLDSTIFVINKMDEAGYDLLDEEEYQRGVVIKKQALINRLRTTINLTPDEERKLKIVCIAADPKGKGLKYWFTKQDDYEKRSHIDDFRQKVYSIVERRDLAAIKDKTSGNSINEMLDNVANAIDSVDKPMQNAIAQSREILKDLDKEAGQLKKELVVSQKEANDSLMSLKNSLLSSTNGSSLDTLGQIIEQDIGIEKNSKTGENEVTFWIFKKNVNEILNTCGTKNEHTFEMMNAKFNFENKYNMSQDIISEAIKKGALGLGKVNISGSTVKAVRDVIAKGYKFKPWGAINLGKDLTKWAGRASVALTAVIEVVTWIKGFVDKAKLEKIKAQLKEAVDTSFAQYFALIENEQYFENFAPSYVQMMKVIKDQNDELDRMQKKMEELEKYKELFLQWKNANVQDAEIV